MPRKRHDPPSRPADGYRPLDLIRNRDPGRHYVFANPNDEETGVNAYLAQGYQLERKRPDGPRLVGGDGVSEGDVITRMGAQLVSIDMSERKAAEQEVFATADAFDRRVLKTGNIEDPMRGRRNGASIGVDRSETEWSQPGAA